jgi:type II secretory pathway component PulK
MLVLWLLVMLVTLGSAAVARLRPELQASQNRINHVRVAWAIRACEQLVLSRYGDRTRPLLADSVNLGRGVWCSIQPNDVFLRININQVDSLGLTRVLESEARAAAVLDWIDADDIPRDEGAEAPWYISQVRVPPRNGPLQDVRELHLIRGLEEVDSASFQTMFTTLGPGRIDPTRASAAVLSSVSALSLATAQRIALGRNEFSPPGRLEDLLRSLGLQVPADVYRQLNQRFVFEPDYRTLLIEGGVRGPGVDIARRMTLTVRLLGTRLAVAEVILE